MTTVRGRIFRTTVVVNLFVYLVFAGWILPFHTHDSRAGAVQVLVNPDQAASPLLTPLFNHDCLICSQINRTGGKMLLTVPAALMVIWMLGFRPWPHVERPDAVLAAHTDRSRAPPLFASL